MVDNRVRICGGRAPGGAGIEASLKGFGDGEDEVFLQDGIVGESGIVFSFRDS